MGGGMGDGPGAAGGMGGGGMGGGAGADHDSPGGSGMEEGAGDDHGTPAAGGMGMGPAAGGMGSGRDHDQDGDDRGFGMQRAGARAPVTVPNHGEAASQPPAAAAGRPGARPQKPDRPYLFYYLFGRNSE